MIVRKTNPAYISGIRTQNRPLMSQLPRPYSHSHEITKTICYYICGQYMQIPFWPIVHFKRQSFQWETTYHIWYWDFSIICGIRSTTNYDHHNTYASSFHLVWISTFPRYDTQQHTSSLAYIVSCLTILMMFEGFSYLRLCDSTHHYLSKFVYANCTTKHVFKCSWNQFVNTFNGIRYAWVIRHISSHCDQSISITCASSQLWSSKL